jgi:hypothetical protein
MTRRVEFGKHGPFDRRYGLIRVKPVPASLRRPGAAELDWYRFRDLFFPKSRRHDSDALAAYESYRDNGPALTTAANTQARQDNAEEPPPCALPRWEWEGGAGPRSIED